MSVEQQTTPTNPEETVNTNPQENPQGEVGGSQSEEISVDDQLGAIFDKYLATKTAMISQILNQKKNRHQNKKRKLSLSLKKAKKLRLRAKKRRRVMKPKAQLGLIRHSPPLRACLKLSKRDGTILTIA